MPSNPLRLLLWRMVGAILAAIIGLIVILVTVCLVGCSQMPVTKGEFAKAKVEQAKVDSKQSDAIASMFNISYGQNGILFNIAPEDVKAEVKAIGKHVESGLSKAEIEAAKARERAALAEREREDLNKGPGAGAWLSAGLGALSGNWSGLLDLAMGALGLGGAAAALRERQNSRKSLAEVVEGVENFAAVEPSKAEVLKTHLSKSMDRKTKDRIKAAKARRTA